MNNEPLDTAAIMAEHHPNVAGECCGDTYDCGFMHPCPTYRLAEALVKTREALSEAAADVNDYANYAGDYLREKWHVDADVARYRALAGESA